MQLHRHALATLGGLAVLGIATVSWMYMDAPTTVINVGSHAKSSSNKSSSTTLTSTSEMARAITTVSHENSTFAAPILGTVTSTAANIHIVITKKGDTVDHDHLPIFQVGLPKSGTTTVALAFQCSGIHTSHYCCCGSNQTHPPCFNKSDNEDTTSSSSPPPPPPPQYSSMGQCLHANIQAHRPMLQDCGDYTFYGQLDAEMGKHGIFLPQHDHLQALHDVAPHATFLLTLRQSPELWATSVLSWFGLGMRFRKTFSLPVAAGISLQEKTTALASIYQRHTQRVREFIKDHPSHRLVEVVVEDPETPSILSKAFGIQPSCWGWYNKGPNHKEKKKNKRRHQTPPQTSADMP